MLVRWLILIGALSLLLSGTSCAQHKSESGSKENTAVRNSDSGWLGVSIADMTPRVAKRMEIRTENGALVKDVVSDSPAEKAGVREDDIIVEFNGKRVDDADDLLSAVRETAPGASATVVFMRSDEKKTSTVEVGKAPHARSYAFSVTPPVMPAPPNIRFFSGAGMFGLTLMDLKKQLAEYFGLPDGHGVLVEEVEKNSRAAKAGIKAGDVIVSIGKESIRRKDDIRWALEDYTEGDKVDVGVIRKGNRQTFTLAMEEDRAGYRWRHGSQDLWIRPEEFDVDVELPSDVPELLFDSEGFKSDMRHLESDMKGLGKDIRRQMHELKVKLRNEMRALSI